MLSGFEAEGLQKIAASSCACWVMCPGATILPSASISSVSGHIGKSADCDDPSVQNPDIRPTRGPPSRPQANHCE